MNNRKSRVIMMKEKLESPDLFEKKDLLVKDKKDNEGKVIPPDGGWGWMVVFGCFLQYIIEAGFLTSYGVLYVDIVERLEVDKIEVSWIGAIRTGIYLGAAPLIAPFTKIVSCRILMIIGGIVAFFSLLATVFLDTLLALLICLGVIQGIAFALVFVSSNIIVNHYFDKKRPLAIGLAVCGAGVGQTVYPLLQDVLLKEYSFSGTMLINAALTLHVIFSGSMYFPLSVKKDKNKRHVKNESVWKNIRNAFDFKVFKIPLFVVFLIHNILLYIGAYVPFSFIPLRVKQHGFSLNDASLFVSMIGLASSIGRILVGLIASYLPNFRPQLYVILTFMAGIMVCISPLCVSYTEFLLFSWGFGIATGGYICLCNVLLIDLFDRKLLAGSLGFVTLAQGIGGFIGSPAAAGISEIIGSDDAIFYFSGGTFILAAIVLQISFLCKPRVKEKELTIDVNISEKQNFESS